MKKYKCINKEIKDLGFSLRKQNRAKTGTFTSRLKSEIQAFCERDDNSRATAGVKETLTKNKIKKL